MEKHLVLMHYFENFNMYYSYKSFVEFYFSPLFWIYYTSEKVPKSLNFIESQRSEELSKREVKSTFQLHPYTDMDTSDINKQEMLIMSF